MSLPTPIPDCWGEWADFPKKHCLGGIFHSGWRRELICRGTFQLEKNESLLRFTQNGDLQLKGTFQHMLKSEDDDEDGDEDASNHFKFLR